MTLDEMRQKGDKIRTAVDRLDDLDRAVIYIYLHRAYGMRISDCERTMARALFQREGSIDEAKNQIVNAR